MSLHLFWEFQTKDVICAYASSPAVDEIRPPMFQIASMALYVWWYRLTWELAFIADKGWLGFKFECIKISFQDADLRVLMVNRLLEGMMWEGWPVGEVASAYCDVTYSAWDYPWTLLQAADGFWRQHLCSGCPRSCPHLTQYTSPRGVDDFGFLKLPFILGMDQVATQDDSRCRNAVG